MQVKFRGIELPEWFRWINTGGRGLASQDVERQSIPNRAGSLVQSRRIPERALPTSFLLIADDIYQFRERVDELNQILLPDDLTDDEIRRGFELVFPDEPDMTYYGIPDGEPDWGEGTDKARGSITFIRSDPHKYGVTQTQLINDASAPSQAIVSNSGGRETYPLVTATITQPTTFFSLYTPEKYLMLGAPVTIDETPLEKEEKVLQNTGGTTVGLANGTTVDGGVVAGEMYSNGNVLMADDYGTGTKWHGPAKKMSVPTPIQDFRVDAYVTNESSSPYQIGRVEVYLLDASNNIIGKMGITDNNPNVTSNGGEARAGGLVDGEYIINEKRRTWNYFRHGIISLERIGNRYRAYFAQRDENDTNKHYARETNFYRDIDLEYQAPLAQVQVHIAGYGTHPTPNLAIHAFHVFKINQDTEVEIPYIAQPGDVITIDHNTNMIRKNGEEFKRALAFGSSLFELAKGENTLAVYPNDAADVELSWRERWL